MDRRTHSTTFSKRRCVEFASEVRMPEFGRDRSPALRHACKTNRRSTCKNAVVELDIGRVVAKATTARNRLSRRQNQGSGRCLCLSIKGTYCTKVRGGFGCDVCIAREGMHWCTCMPRLAGNQVCSLTSTRLRGLGLVFDLAIG